MTTPRYICPYSLTKWLNILAKKEELDNLNTEQKIYEAAKKVFQRKGWAGSRMQEIADEAGINKALLHYYFRSKDKLFKAVFKEIMGKVLPQILHVLNDENDLEKKVRLIVDRYFEVLIANPQMPLFVLNELKNNPQQFPEEMGFKEIIKLDKLALQLEQEYKDGNIKKTDPFHFIMNIVSLCIFPFIGRPIFQNIFEYDDEMYLLKIKERKEKIPDLIMHGLKS